jgi:putative addiction module component (TIGR02574 family)
MTPNAATLIRDGLALDVDERSVVANALLESIDDAGDAGEVDDAWRVVVSRRLAEMRSGAVEMIDADELFAELRASVAE